MTGPVGVGKTAVLHEADLLLIEPGAHHATVELEELARCWPETNDGDARTVRLQDPCGDLVEFRRRRRIAAPPGRSRRPALGVVPRLAAVPGAAVTVVRLHAPLPVLEQRIRLREPGTPETEIDGARWWTERLHKTRPEDHLVQTEGRSVTEIAREVLRLASWL